MGPTRRGAVPRRAVGGGAVDLTGHGGEGGSRLAAGRPFARDSAARPYVGAGCPARELLDGGGAGLLALGRGGAGGAPEASGGALQVADRGEMGRRRGRVG